MDRRKFDFHFAETAGFTLPPQDCWHDGMIVAHAINERRSVALEFGRPGVVQGKEAAESIAVKNWLNPENRRRRKVARGRPSSSPPTSPTSPARSWSRPGWRDVILTRRICDSQDQVLLNKPELTRVVEFERETMGSLFDIEKEGLPADRHGYNRLKHEALSNLEILHQRCCDLAGDDDFKPNSTAQIEEAFKRRGADLSFTTKKNGKFSADADNLRAVHDELAVAIVGLPARSSRCSRPMSTPWWGAPTRRR